MTSPLTTSSTFSLSLGSAGFENDRNFSIMINHVKTGKNRVVFCEMEPDPIPAIVKISTTDGAT